MAGADAVRGTGSLLVRALAVGGITAAAWLFGGAVASADPGDHLPDASSISEFVHATISEHHESVEDKRPELQDIRDQWTATLGTAPVDLAFLDPARVPEENFLGPTRIPVVPEDDSWPQEDDEYSQAVSPVYSGGVLNSGTDRSGTVSNTMPEELYTEKVAAKVAAKLAAAPAPTPVEVAVPVAAEVVATVVDAPQWSIPAVPASAPVAEATDTPETGGLEWEVPRPAAPTPTPQPAQAPTAPTASSSAHDNSGGTRGGIAVTTAQASPHRSSVWTAARRDDGRTPGSVQGLPSSSPD